MELVMVLKPMRGLGKKPVKLIEDSCRHYYIKQCHDTVMFCDCTRVCMYSTVCGNVCLKVSMHDCFCFVLGQKTQRNPTFLLKK